MIKYICDRCKQEFITNDAGISLIMDIEFILKGHTITNEGYGGGVEDHCYQRLQLCDKCFKEFQDSLRKFVEDYKCSDI